MRGRKAKPNALKIAEGSRNVRPEPEFPDGVGAPPSHLNEVARIEWGRIVELLSAQRILKQTDRACIAAYCCAYSRWVKAEAEIEQNGVTVEGLRGGTIKNPACNVAHEAMLLVHKFACEFGLTPAARQKVGPGVAASEPGSELASFMRLAQ